YRPRPFRREDFRAFMLRQSIPFPETIAVARNLARTCRYWMMTINNESAELNEHRLQVFGLRDIFDTFFTSCWVGVLKPSRQIYERALVMSQADPSAAVFIDDREHNLETARLLGMRTVLYLDAPRLRRDLAALAVAIGRRSGDATGDDRIGPHGRQHGAAAAPGGARGRRLRSQPRRDPDTRAAGGEGRARPRRHLPAAHRPT